MPTSLDTALLRKALRSGSAALVQRLVDRLDPSGLALLLTQLPLAELKALLRSLNAPRLLRAFHAIPEELTASIFEQFDDTFIATLLGKLSADEAINLLHPLNDDRQASVLALVEPHHRQQITRLMRYEEDRAGHLMMPRFVAVSENATVAEAISAIRNADSDVPIFYLYVVNDQGKLIGVSSLGRLVRAKDETPLSQLITTHLISVSPDADQEEVAKVLSQHNLLALPVVEEGRLVGLITVDDVIDIIEKEATEDMYNMAGLSRGDRVFSRPRDSLQKRLPWNALNLLTSLLAALMVSLFEDTISKLVALATFMPVIAGIGGNTGNQTLTVMIRGITLGELEFSSTYRALVKEILVGIGIGLILGITTGTISYLWKGNIMLGVVIALAMIANLFVAALAGTAIPLSLRRFGLDPALGGSILVTMCTDVFGFLAFLGLAALMMHTLL